MSVLLHCASSSRSASIGTRLDLSCRICWMRRSDVLASSLGRFCASWLQSAAALKKT